MQKFVLDEKQTKSQIWHVGENTKFAILDEIWTKSRQLIAKKKCQSVIEFDIYFWEEISNSFMYITGGLNQWIPKMIWVRTD